MPYSTNFLAAAGLASQAVRRTQSNQAHLAQDHYRQDINSLQLLIQVIPKGQKDQMMTVASLPLTKRMMAIKDRACTCRLLGMTPAIVDSPAHSSNTIQSSTVKKGPVQDRDLDQFPI
jgi:hypothetical protein